MPFFELFDQHLAKRSKSGLKFKVNLGQFSPETQETIVAVLNENITNARIIKHCGEWKRKAFMVKGRVYLEQWWVDDMQSYAVTLYPLPDDTHLTRETSFNCGR